MAVSFILSAPTPSEAGRITIPGEDPLPFLACPGDCNGDDEVTVDEILSLVTIALGNSEIDSCENLLVIPEVTEIVQAVNVALFGCPEVTRFELMDGSRVLLSPEVNNPSAIVVEPLSGTMTTVLSGFEPQTIHHEITDLLFESDSFVVSPEVLGLAGKVSLLIGDQVLVRVRANLLVHDAPVRFGGSNQLPELTVELDTLDAIELCSAPCEQVRMGELEGFILDLSFQ